MEYKNLWIKNYPSLNTNIYDTLPKLCFNNDNIYLLFKSFGYVSGYSNNGGSDLILGKFNLFGNVEWVKQTEYSSSRDEDFPQIIINKNNTIYVSYQNAGNLSISKINDINGSILWNNNIHISNFINGNISQLPIISGDINDDLIMVYKNSNVDNIDIILCKHNDVDGNIIWKKEYIETNNFINSNPNINTDISGNIFISYMSYNDNTNDIGLMKINNYDGSILWKKYYKELNITNKNTSPSLHIDTTGNLYISYETILKNTDNNINLVFIKLDNNGKLLWARQKKTFNTIFNSSSPIISGELFFSYQTNGVLIDNDLYHGTDIIFGKLDSISGSLLWIKQQQISDICIDNLCHAMTTDSNNAIYISYQIINQSNNYDILLSKFNIPEIVIEESFHIKNLKQLLKRCPNNYNSITKNISNNIQFINNLYSANNIYSSAIHYVYLDIS
jgi:hypothetical protein